MRLAFLISSLEMGGAQRVAAALVRHWIAAGHDVAVIVTFSGKGSCYYELPEKARIIYLADEAKQCGKFLPSRLGRLFALRRLLTTVNPDIVVSFLTDSNLAAILASIGNKWPVIVSERSYPPRDKLPKVYEILRFLLYPSASCVVFPTNAGVEWLKKNIPRAKVAMIPNPTIFPIVRTPPYVDACLDPDAKIILAVGRLVSGKGHDELLRAFALICERFPTWKLAIAGGGANAESLGRIARELGLEDRVLFLGPVGNVGDWYERAEVFVLPSHYEGFPNVLVEAMSHGCACVSYDCDTGPREVIEHRRNGLLVADVGNIWMLSDGIAEVLGDEVLRMRMSSNALVVRKTFSPRAIMGKWDALMESLISRAAEGEA